MNPSLRCRGRRTTPSVFIFSSTAATTEIYTLSLHDALPICLLDGADGLRDDMRDLLIRRRHRQCLIRLGRSEEHTSELQSQFHLVCRLLLEKKKKCLVLDQGRSSGDARLRRPVLLDWLRPPG